MKSVLFGTHCFLLHPWFVAAGWWQLYGFPWDPRLWVAFTLHDLGYLGKPNMDGPEGEAHVELGARIMAFLFGRPWGDFCRYHSRFRAKQDGQRPSKLCFADKLAIALVPAWLYLPLARWTGEIREYMQLARPGPGEPRYASMQITTDNEERWYAEMQEYCRRWVAEHKDGRADLWTPCNRTPLTGSGVYR